MEVFPAVLLYSAVAEHFQDILVFSEGESGGGAVAPTATQARDLEGTYDVWEQ